MGLLQFILAILFLLIINFVSTSTSSSIPVNVNPPNPIAKPGCIDRCGDVSIPFPFGTREGCYLNASFLVTCNHTKLFLRHSNINLTSIFLTGQLRILKYIVKDCYYRNGTRYPYNDSRIKFGNYSVLTINNTANKFTVVGCDTDAFVYGSRLNGKFFRTGCNSWCGAKEDLVDGMCSGLGCCQTSIPKEIRNVSLRLGTYVRFKNVWDFNNCSYAFVVEEGAFTFNSTSLSSLRDVHKLPMVVDWAVGDGNCEQAQTNMSSYACKSTNSTCHDNDNGYGYRCYCQDGYQGNPYLANGCQDVNECQKETLNNCVKGSSCVNKLGRFECVCPKGYHGDGRKGGKGCIRVGESIIFKLVGGIATGVSVFLLAACCLYLEYNRRKMIRMKQKFFQQNGGLMLQEQLARRGKSQDMAKIFTSAELNKATNNFHDSRIIGQGGFGTVYKGFLSEDRIVAIKKSKVVDPTQVEQFINEVIVLSQINHKNVVKLLGCCLETQVPLLVYEFINNGTLFQHIHDKTKARELSWDKRLRIAAEAAGVLAYLHSAASPLIIHRDVKSANILLDTSFTAKVSDFGASRLVPLDKTQIYTMLQGTFGYLDPEYMQTNKLSGKSDVYSFGVVLVELLTGKKALSYDSPEEERNLASYFLSKLKDGHLFQIVDDSIICNQNVEQLTSIAMLAKRCLYVKGDERPSMKEVAMELEGLRQSETHVTRVQSERNIEETQCLVSMEMPSFAYGEGSSNINTNYCGSRDLIVSPMDSGR